LCEKQNEFEKLNTRVFIISFGTFPAVQKWLEDTCPNFTVLIDKDRSLYKAYGLNRSYWRSRNLRTRWHYFKAWLQGKKSKTYAEHEDTSQLGGDFIIDKNGIIQFAYPSHDPTDRPVVESLLEVLRKV
jgi:peroxiredoxin